MPNPLVTIITPSYNQADFLEDTICSVLDQDYPNIEYIVIDGGSSDESVDIIRKYEDRLAWWVSEPDKGQSDAINIGFRRAKGEIVAWLNSDDVYLPGAVTRAVQALKNSPGTALVYADLLSINAQGDHFNTIRYRQFDLIDLLAFSIIGQPTVFMRKEYLEKTGHLDTSYHYLMDHHLWLRMAANAPIKYVQDEWAAARFHQQAKNVSQAKQFGEEAYRILDWAETQPQMAEALAADPKRILGGAHRFNARYLLDGGAPREALKTYVKVFQTFPKYALQHWHRILFCLVSLLGFGGLRKLFGTGKYIEMKSDKSKNKATEDEK